MASNKHRRLDPDGSQFSQKELLNAPLSSLTSMDPSQISTDNSISGQVHHPNTSATITKPIYEKTCEHCGWTGKSILQHMRYNKSCKDKTDMSELRKLVKEQNRLIKNMVQKKYDEAHKKEKQEYQKKYDETHKSVKQEY